MLKNISKNLHNSLKITIFVLQKKDKLKKTKIMKWICQIYDWDVTQVIMEQVMDDESAQLFREFCEESDIEYLCEPC